MGFNKGIAEGLLLALQLCGCVRETTLDAGLPRKVVVEFVLTDESVQNLYLSLTGEPGETVNPAVGEAEIKLLDVSQNMEMDQFVRVADNQWALEYSGIPGHKYRLEIKVDGYDRVWAEQTMPEKAELPGLGYGLAVYFDLEPRLDYPDWGLYYSIEDIPDFLIIRGVIRDKETGKCSMVEELCTDYPGVEEMNVSGLLYDGNPQRRTREGEDGVWTYLFPSLIGKALYKDFLFIHRVDENHPGLENLYDNFHASNKGKGFCVGGSFINNRYPPNDHYDEYLLLYSLSADYGRFLKDAYQSKKVREGGDLSSIYLRENIFTNVQGGGLGIFGTMSTGMAEYVGIYQTLEGFDDYLDQ